MDRELWASTQLLLRSHTARSASRARKSTPSPLTGTLFDASGQRLTPSHAVKGARRYRYYVSCNLSKGTGDAERNGWRLPAPELERAVVSAACTMLSDQTAMADAALASGLAERQLPSLFSRAAAWLKRLQSQVEAGAALTALVDRLDLRDAGMCVRLKLPHASADPAHGGTAATLTITRLFPLQIRRRGFELRLLLPGAKGQAPRRTSPSLNPKNSVRHQS